MANHMINPWLCLTESHIKNFMYMGCKELPCKTICTKRLSAEKNSISVGGDGFLSGTELSVWNALKTVNI